MGWHFLLQGIFPTQGSNPHLLHWQTDSYHCAIWVASLEQILGFINMGLMNGTPLWGQWYTRQCVCWVEMMAFVASMFALWPDAIVIGHGGRRDSRTWTHTLCLKYVGGKIRSNEQLSTQTRLAVALLLQEVDDVRCGTCPVPSACSKRDTTFPLGTFGKPRTCGQSVVLLAIVDNDYNCSYIGKSYFSK